MRERKLRQARGLCEPLTNSDAQIFEDAEFVAAYQQTPIWLATLSPRRGDEDHAARQRLSEAYVRSRERAVLVAKQIAVDLPDLTVHDETHFDALWEIASLVQDESEITPTEAFILGVTFLIHDLGLGLAALPDGLESLRQRPLWRDSIAHILRKRLGRSPSLDEINTADDGVRSAATRQMLRALHAEHAERFATEAWDDENGSPHYLIQDDELRFNYGNLIGRIARSHWWPAADLPDAFPTVLGAPAWQEQWPVDWTIDPLKVACLLRVADALHLDARRAPRFLRFLRDPDELARAHWLFQEKLNRPIIEGDRVVFTAARGFPVDQAEAWWLCFDTLSATDTYLLDVDLVLTENQRPRLRARGVAAVGDPKRFAERIPTEGWTPVDAQVHVSDVSRLVGMLGGQELYGENATVALRELIQNASDAVRARRQLEGRDVTYGRITVRLFADGSTTWIEVEDDGIGMSRTVLTDVLLDFGTSYWDTPLAVNERPGLLGGGFRPTGRFGIGFFSVLMLGDSVEVTSRRYEDAQRETNVLEFRQGVRTRPLLRDARETEWLRDGGTRVRVALRVPPSEPGGLLARRRAPAWTLKQLVAFLAPALAVDVEVEEDGVTRTVIQANDWLTISAEELLGRVAVAGDEEEESAALSELQKLADHMQLVRMENGTEAARAFIVPHTYARNPLHHSQPGVITVGGLRATSARAFCGVIVGDAATAARDVAVPVIPADELARWATEQAGLLYAAISEPHLQGSVADTIIACGGDPDGLVFAETSEGWKDYSGLIEWARDRDEIIAVSELWIESERERGSDMQLGQSVVLVESGHIYRVSSRTAQDWPPSVAFDGVDSGRFTEANSVAGALVRAISAAWDVTPKAVLNAMSASREHREIALRDGQPFTESPHFTVVRSAVRR